MQQSKSIKLIQIVVMTILCVLMGKTFASADHSIIIKNNSAFPVQLNNITAVKCIKTQFGGGGQLNPGDSFTIDFTDSNSFLVCDGSDKIVRFDLTSQVFNSNPIYGNQITNGIEFKHFGTSGGSWYTSVHPDYKNNLNVSCQAHNTSGPLINCEDAHAPLDGTTAYVTVNNPNSFTFYSQMQIYNLSLNSFYDNGTVNTNCKYSNDKTPPRIIYSGNSFESYTMEITPNNQSNLGICKTSMISGDAMQAFSGSFGITTTYPTTSLSFINTSTVGAPSTSNFTQCFNSDGFGGVLSITVESPSKCFRGCPFGYSSAGNNQKPQYRYYHRSRIDRNIQPLNPITDVATDYSKVTSNDKQNFALQCIESGLININAVSPRFIKDPKSLNDTASYLLSKNKQYYLFCQIGKDVNNKVAISIVDAKKNLLVKRKIYNVDGIPTDGALVLIQTSGYITYLQNDRKAGGFIIDPFALKIGAQPTTIQITDNGEFIYSNSVGKVYEKF